MSERCSRKKSSGLICCAADCARGASPREPVLRHCMRAHRMRQHVQHRIAATAAAASQVRRLSLSIFFYSIFPDPKKGGKDSLGKHNLHVASCNNRSTPNFIFIRNNLRLHVFPHLLHVSSFLFLVFFPLFLLVFLLYVPHFFLTESCFVHFYGLLFAVVPCFIYLLLCFYTSFNSSIYFSFFIFLYPFFYLSFFSFCVSVAA